MTYEETMAYGAGQYADVVVALDASGLRGEFTQSGGMCAAIVVNLDSGYYLLFTDRDDTLSWDRRDHVGWFCGLYEPEATRASDGPRRWLEVDDGSAEEAVRISWQILRGNGAERES